MDGQCFMKGVGQGGDCVVIGNDGEDERWGCSGEEGKVEVMEPGEVVVLESVLWRQSLACRDVKRDLLYP